MAAKPGVTETVDTLVCDGKTLRGSIDQTASGAAQLITQVSLYSKTFGVAIGQNTYATGAGGVIKHRLIDDHKAPWQASNRERKRPRPHLDVAGQARPRVGGGKLTGQRHDPGGALQRARDGKSVDETRDYVSSLRTSASWPSR